MQRLSKRVRRARETPSKIVTLCSHSMPSLSWGISPSKNKILVKNEYFIDQSCCLLQDIRCKEKIKCPLCRKEFDCPQDVATLPNNNATLYIMKLKEKMARIDGSTQAKEQSSSTRQLLCFYLVLQKSGNNASFFWVVYIVSPFQLWIKLAKTRLCLLMRLHSPQ